MIHVKWCRSQDRACWGMDDVSGLIVLSVRSAAADDHDWERWSTDDHLPRVAAVAGVRAVTRLAVVPRPPVGMPGPGFTHIELVELVGHLDQAVTSVRAELVAERNGADGRADHAIVAGDVLVPHGPHGTKIPPAPALTGHVLANVLCTDVTSEPEWDRWYDEQHLPDMVATGAFSAGSRWRRRLRPQWGAAHVTLYDIELADVNDAVHRSAAAMPALIAGGRKHPNHCGGPTLVLQRS